MVGSPIAYAELARIIEAGWRGTRSLSHPQHPVSAPLTDLTVVDATGSRVMFRTQGSVLVLSGSPPVLSLLATNLRGLGTVVKPGTHTHWEYVDGQPLFDPLSVPMTVEVTDDEAY